MILTVKRKIILNQKQIKFYNESIECFSMLSECISNNIENGNITFSLDYYINNKVAKLYLDKFALEDILIEARTTYKKTGKYSKIKYNNYSLINSKNNILVDKNTIKIYGFDTIYVNLNNNNIPCDSKIYKILIKKEYNTFYICIYYHFNYVYKNIEIRRTIGLDYSIYNFYVDSNGNKPYMFEYIKIIDKIKNLHSILTSKQYNSNNYNKIKIKIDKLYSKIRNIKNEYINKISNYLINNFDLIAVENIELAELARRNYKDRNNAKHKYGKYIYMFSYNEFVKKLYYKAQLNNKIVVMVDKYYPSSKLCNYCGFKNYITDDVTKRIITCPSCGKTYDRDINAAKNILKEGIRLYNLKYHSK